MFERVFLGLGSNVGDRFAFLKRARKSLEEQGAILKKSSSIYETAPIGVEYQGDFLNQVLEIETKYNPLELLRIILNIEVVLAARSPFRWGPRSLDIDLLLYGSRSFKTKELLLPHPEIENRRFVLEPLYELDYKLVLKGKPISVLLSQVQDQRVVLFSDVKEEGKKERVVEDQEEEKESLRRTVKEHFHP